MKVIREKRWSYVLLDTEQGWILTFLIGGPVEVDVSILLTDAEVARIKNDPATIDALMKEFASNRDAIAGREIKPPIWPSLPS